MIGGKVIHIDLTQLPVLVDDLQQRTISSDKLLEINDSHQRSNGLTQLVEMYKGHPLETDLKNKLNEIDQAKKNVIKFDPNLYDDIHTLCKLMGVLVYTANWEADALCSKLYESGQVQAVMSEDSDMLLYKAGRLIRKFTWENTVELIDLHKLLEGLGINYIQFVDLCILCGTDYTVNTISNIGAIRALELIRQGLTIEQLISNIKASQTSSDKTLQTYKKYRLPTDLNDFDYQSARDLINRSHSLEPDIELTPFDISNIQFDKLEQMMTNKCKYKSGTLLKHFEQIKSATPLLTKIKPLLSGGEKIKIRLKK